MHERRRLIRTTSRTARPTTVFLFEFDLVLRPLAMVSRPIVLVNQMLWQVAANGRQCIAYFGHNQREEARFTAAQGGDEGEQGVEVFLRTGLEFAGFEGDARHHVDEGAGYVEDFFNLRGRCQWIEMWSWREDFGWKRGCLRGRCHALP